MYPRTVRGGMVRIAVSILAVAATAGASVGDTMAMLGSARSSALAAGAATGGGLAGMQDNIASLASQPGWAVSGTWLSWLEGARVGQVSAAVPSAIGVVGLSFGGLSAGRVDIVEETGPVRTVDAQRDMVASAGIARSIAPGFEAGIACRWIRSALAETWVATASALDAGARFTSADGGLSLGAAVGNAVATSLAYEDERRVLPRTVTAGAAWRLVRARLVAVMLAVDYAAAGGGQDSQSAGAEVGLVGTLALRAGVRQSAGTRSLSAGIGANWRNMRFDYAMASPAGLGTVSRATLTVGL